MKKITNSKCFQQMFSNKIASGEFCRIHFVDPSGAIHMLKYSCDFRLPSEISLA